MVEKNKKNLDQIFSEIKNYGVITPSNWILAKHHNQSVIQNAKTVAFNRITFSEKEKSADVFIESVTANPFVKIKTSGIEINSHLIGLYNANNINAAITFGNHFKVPINEIKVAIESYIPENNRSQLLTKVTNEIILDAYNANPSSMLVALENFIQLDKSNKIAIIGDMYELGDESMKEHKAIVSFLYQHANFECYFIGKDFFVSSIKKNNLHFYKTFEEFSHTILGFKLQHKT